ncbi:hypothetical protein FDJ23_gp260 [Erwinia phage vB_EamM_Desertfox]|uniref:Uncharacterized protein n=3 Tax=Agricanvirus TaxID=1984776 RepID=A0A482ID79_9CAUD|nr:hypothetical protein FDJ23_gp260 [Erwinia phage vB_EamM_Desertfox]AUG86367.1 hypothetical protein DESERTFOX_260 [Erwinia phage vB_EamM_Desertfox]AUG87013.1 hypothetical protein MORTIMER_265 [Erwinia phage vB_EamM_Mortimer]QBP07365.1 hypothetical protein REBECCA_260 [Erwinia phage Rebecca]
MCNMRSDWFVEDEPSMQESDPHFDNHAMDGLMAKIRDFVKESDAATYVPQALFGEAGKVNLSKVAAVTRPVDHLITLNPVANDGDVYLDFARGKRRGYKPH